jgi:cytochrome b subunit of formate dehydrogenase
MKENSTPSDSGENRDPGNKSLKRYFVRLNRSEIIQHLIFVICFIVLIVTGFMDKLPESIINKMGEAKETVFTVRSILHRIAGTVMIMVSVYHVYYVLFKRAGRRWLLSMIPTVQDARDFVDNMLYLLGVKDQEPEFDRFSYKHKFEYLALIVGTTLMSITGILLWTEQLWSKFYIDIAALVHRMEAVLAGLAIIVWHLYEVHFRPEESSSDNMWLTGLIDEHHMKEEHAVHYKKIMADPNLQKIYMKEENPLKDKKLMLYY